MAEQTLSYFSVASSSAEADLRGPRSHDANSLVGLTVDNAHTALKNLSSITESRRQALEILRDEPAIARILVEDEDGKRRVYYIARATPTTSVPGVVVANYRSPVGRLATLPVGTEFALQTPRGSSYVEILEKVTLRPIKRDVWDSLNSVIHFYGQVPFTAASLRDLFQVESGEDILERLLSEDRVQGNIQEGIQRDVIIKMGLRDRPLLDQFQDEIFRLPIDSRAVLLGPPGSGKTTTIIKRLGLKLDWDHLTDDEKKLVERTTSGQGKHSQSWILFTPTELLKQYVKESFARENVPASDQRIQTWSDFRRIVARNQFKVLRSGVGGGILLMRDGLSSLQSTTLLRQPSWFEEFDRWQNKNFWDDLAYHASIIARADAPGLARVGRQITAALSGIELGSRTSSSLLSLMDEVEDIQRHVSSLKVDTDKKIRSIIASMVRREVSILDDLLRFSETLEDATDPTDDIEPDDDDEASAPRGGREAAFELYAKVIRALARAHVSKRAVGRRTRTGRIAEWLGSRVPSAEELNSIGQSLEVLTSARRFVSPIKRYFSGIGRRYLRFRAECRKSGLWYSEEIPAGEVNPIEVDVVLLSLFRMGRVALQDQRIRRDIDQQRYDDVRVVNDLLRTQVLVDEATDFSPVQLACMAALCDPAAVSFMACGDFNQRITEWGSRGKADLEWVFPGIDVRPITITYRHSRQLNDLASAIAALSGNATTAAKLPEHVNSEGVAPVLRKGISDVAQVADWLAARVGEIERFTRSLPSIAVLVSSEAEIENLAKTLDEALSPLNLRAVACPGGRVVGQENDVRVFSVEHIKGLEFEAVFFLGIDRLAGTVGDLFDKYLYVGATRAATYLGMTTEGSTLPLKILSLEEMFIESWG
jgi:hypothetical protein